ncbi:MAG: hypothetical protein WAV25_02070 [Minisyncoccia bacterium]
MNIQKFIESKNGRHLIGGFVILILVVIIFRMGIEIGFREARFSSRLGDNYSGNLYFDGGMMGMMRSGLVDGHGASGKVLRITPPTMVVATGNNLEKIIRFTDDTLIRKYRDSISSSDIQLDDYVVVIGYPNDDGEIVAKLVRVMPANISVQATTTVNIK